MCIVFMREQRLTTKFTYFVENFVNVNGARSRIAYDMLSPMFSLIFEEENKKKIQ